MSFSDNNEDINETNTNYKNENNQKIILKNLINNIRIAKPIEIQKLDDNPGKKTVITEKDKIGENIYYSVFTSTILYDNTLGIYKNTKGEFLLNKGDYIIVNVKNTNVTLATQIKNFLFKIVGKDTHTIAASATALIINSGRSN